MAYTAAQYAAQERLMVLARWSHTTGLCPVCRVRPLADWPDGVRRATCASHDCHARWLSIRPPAPTPAIGVDSHAAPAGPTQEDIRPPAPTPAIGVDSHAAPAGPTQEDGFTVGLVIG